MVLITYYCIKNSGITVNEQNSFEVGREKLVGNVFNKENKDLVLIYLMYNEYNQSTVKTQPLCKLFA